MPLYEYQCENCGDVFELIEKFSAEPLTVHEKCGGKVHRLISAPALQFKGSGWYVTDYAKGGAANPGKSDGGKKDGEGSSDKSDKKDTGKSSSDSSAGTSGGTSSESSSSPSTATTSSTSTSSSDKK
jgi:putative FmdB family regulatory protein